MAIQYLGTTISGVSGDTKPTLTANELGVVFVETNTDKVYQWDGDSWNEVTSDASNLSGTTLNSDIITSSITTVAALNAGSITSGFTSIDVGSGAITTTGTITAGNLDVTGTTTTVDSTNTTISDRLIELANGAGSSTADAGIIVERGSTGDNAIMAWDESTDKWIVGTTTATGASTGDLTIATGTITATLDGAAPAGSLSGATLASGVTASSLQSVGTLNGLTVTGSTALGNLTLANGSITDSSGAITFVNETLTTTGLITGGGFTSTSDFTTTAQATDWDLIDNNASALSFDAAGKTGILQIVTTDSSEGVTMSGTLNVTGAATLATVDIGAGAIDGTTIGATSASTIVGSSLTGTSLDINGAADISGDLTLSAGADGALRFSVASSIKILDNSATSLVIEEADNAYLTFNTANSGGEKITVGKIMDFGAGFNVGSDAAGDILYHNGTSYIRLAKPGTPAGEVLTFATGETAPSWAEAAGGGDSFVDAKIRANVLVTAGDPCFLQSDGTIIPYDVGRGAPKTLLALTDTQGDGSNSGIGQLNEEMKVFEHVYSTPSAGSAPGAHVFFMGSMRNNNAAASSITDDEYYAVTFVATVTSAGVWTTGPIQEWPDSSDSQDFSSPDAEHRFVWAAYNPEENVIGVVWKDNDNDIQFNHCRVTGTGSSIGLEWGQTAEVDDGAYSILDFETCGGDTSTNETRWLVNYRDTSSDLALKAFIAPTFATNTSAISTLGSEYVTFTSAMYSIDYGIGITYNPTTNRFLSAANHSTGGRPVLACMEFSNATTSTTIQGTFGGSTTGYFSVANDGTTYESDDQVGHWAYFMCVDQTNEKWVMMGSSAESNGVIRFATLKINTSTSGGSDPFIWYKAMNGGSTTMDNNAKFSMSSYAGYTSSNDPFRKLHFKNQPANNPSNYKLPDSSNIESHLSLFMFGVNNEQGGGLSGGDIFWSGVGWDNDEDDLNSVSMPTPTGPQNVSPYGTRVLTERSMSKYDSSGARNTTSDWDHYAYALGTYNTRYYDYWYEIGCKKAVSGSTQWFYDPDAQLWFMFLMTWLPNNTRQSWDFGIAYWILPDPLIDGTTGNAVTNSSDRNTGGSTPAGTYIGVAQETATGSDPASTTVKVVIPGGVVTGLSDLAIGAPYFMDDEGTLVPRMPIHSATNKRVGTALSATVLKVDDSAEATGWPYYPTATAGQFLFTTP